MIRPRISPCAGLMFPGQRAWRCSSPGSRTSYVSSTPLAAYRRWLVKYRPQSESTRREKRAMALRVGLGQYE